MTRLLLDIARDGAEIVALGAFLSMIALLAQAFGA